MSLTRIHQKLGTAGFIVSIVALVAALSGGAYAAGGGLTGKEKKEVKKIAKKFAGKQGKRGKNGQNGQNGANGAVGPAGPPGAKGATGAPGTPGGPGGAGRSVVASPIAVGEVACNGLGGTMVEVEGSGEAREVCNGEEGAPGTPGQEGSPWTDGGTLPEGATETGTWAFVGGKQTFKDGEEKTVTVGASERVPISFTIPLAAPLVGSHVINTVNTPDPVHCPGTAASPNDPAPASGYLCLYQVAASGAGVGGTVPGSLTTAGLAFSVIVIGNPASANGTWAVTG